MEGKVEDKLQKWVQGARNYWGEGGCSGSGKDCEIEGEEPRK